MHCSREFLLSETLGNGLSFPWFEFAASAWVWILQCLYVLYVGVQQNCARSRNGTRIFALQVFWPSSCILHLTIRFKKHLKTKKKRKRLECGTLWGPPNLLLEAIQDDIKCIYYVYTMYIYICICYMYIHTYKGLAETQSTPHTTLPILPIPPNTQTPSHSTPSLTPPHLTHPSIQGGGKVG